MQGNVDKWLNGPVDKETKEEIFYLQKNNPDKLKDAFYTTLSFGTGGLRGLMGVGTNRFNIYTIQMATQGLANYLLTQKPTRDRHYVFIGYDSRHRSQEFASEAACVLAGNGIEVYLLPELRPTPFISFGVRRKNCSAGIMITASHNPKEYNGYKVYWSNGAQVVPPHDTGIFEEMQKITEFDQIKRSEKNSTHIQIVDPELDLEYLEEIKKLQIDQKQDKQIGSQLKITYTPLHGTGIKCTPKALKEWGFTNINLVDRQIIPDGDFPTVQTPNPENAETLSMGIKQMQDTASDVLIANDPDADRMAVVTLHREKPFILSGNQIATICLEYICHTLQQYNRLPKNGACVSTIVSTDLLKIISTNYNITYFNVLTGFKYIGQLISQWETTNHPYQFLFGAEESYGYLYGTHSLDKDAVIASCLIAEIALLMKIEGQTLVDYLKTIYQKYGFYLERQKTLIFDPGKMGKDLIAQKMQNLRKHPPKTLLDSPVTTILDYQKGIENIPKSNVLLYRLQDKSKVVIRPSGTEPKLKIYGAVYKPTWMQFDETLSSCETKVKKLLTSVEELLTSVNYTNYQK